MDLRNSSHNMPSCSQFESYPQMIEIRAENIATSRLHPAPRGPFDDGYEGMEAEINRDSTREVGLLGCV